MNYNDYSNQYEPRKSRNTIDPTNPNQQDCYFFLYSHCNRTGCTFRHSYEAKETQEVCPLYQRKELCNGLCMKRHSLYHLDKRRDAIMCYYETNSECTKPNCEYKHKNPMKDFWKKSNQNSQPTNDFESKLEKLNVAKQNLDKSNLSESEKQEIIDRILQELRKGGF